MEIRGATFKKIWSDLATVRCAALKVKIFFLDFQVHLGLTWWEIGIKWVLQAFNLLKIGFLWSLSAPILAHFDPIYYSEKQKIQLLTWVAESCGIFTNGFDMPKYHSWIAKSGYGINRNL